MPKLINRNPKLSKLQKYAVSYYRGKIYYFGIHGTPEALTAYNRFCAELQSNSAVPLPKAEKHVTVRELAAAFLDYAKASIDPISYGHYRIVILDFLKKLYGDATPVDDFKPSCLKLVRETMIQSGRLSRKTINDHIRRLIRIFAWGVENDVVQETVWNALKAVKSLSAGHPGTYENAERQPVPDEVVIRTLPFMPQTLRAMVQVQRLLGARPNEIFKMRVGDIDTTQKNGLWYYVPGSYKTARHVGKIVFPLGKPEQDLIAPYLVGKTADAAVFSPRTAMAERHSERRKNRKTKVPPSQAARQAERLLMPSPYDEFYNRDSYRTAISHAITKGNKVLPEEQKIPHWHPYLLRNSAATDIEAEMGLDEAQAQLGHKTANMTRRYSKAQLRIRESLARKVRLSMATLPRCTGRRCLIRSYCS